MQSPTCLSFISFFLPFACRSVHHSLPTVLIMRSDTKSAKTPRLVIKQKPWCVSNSSLCLLFKTKSWGEHCIQRSFFRLPLHSEKKKSAIFPYFNMQICMCASNSATASNQTHSCHHTGEVPLYLALCVPRVVNVKCCC